MAVEENGEVFPADAATAVADLETMGKDVLVASILRGRKEKQKMEKHKKFLENALKGAESSVSHLEKQSERVQQAHERELGLMFDESIAMRSEMEYKSTELILENQRMKDEIGTYTVVEEQNKMLRRALDKQHKEAEEEATRLKKELHDLKESVIEHKNKLQKEFRLRLQAMSTTMHDEVLQAYKKERSHGHGGMGGGGGGGGMQSGAEGEDSNTHVSVMMDRYSHLEAKHAKMKLDHGLAQQSMETQTKQMLRLKRELLESRERCSSLDADLSAVRGEAHAVRHQMRQTQKHKEEAEEASYQLTQLREQFTTVLRQADSWKRKAKRSGGTQRAGTPGSAGTLGSQRPATAADGNFAGSARPPLPSMDLQARAASSLGTMRPYIGTISGGAGSRPGTSDSMNFGKIYESMRPVVETVVLPQDDLDVRKIWNSRFTSPLEFGDASLNGSYEDEGGDQFDGYDDEAGSETGKLPQRATVGKYAQLHIPDAPMSVAQGRRSAPGKMFASGDSGRKARSAPKQRFF